MMGLASLRSVRRAWLAATDGFEYLREAGREALPGPSLLGYLVYQACRLSPAKAWILGSVLLFAVFSAVAGQGSAVAQRIAIETSIYAVATVGLYIFVGNTGIICFSHAGFMAVGAYASALLTLTPEQKGILLMDCPPFLQGLHFSAPVAILIACALAAVLALAFGFPLLKLSGMHATIATLAVLVITYVVIGNWDAVTGGQNTLLNIPIHVTGWKAFAAVLAAVAIAYAYQESKFGLLARASRDDRFAARSLGVVVRLQRLIAFMVSGAMMAFAGALHAHFYGSLVPDAFYLQQSFVLISMLVVGGSTHLGGALVGSMVMTLLGEVLRRGESGLDIGSFHLETGSGLREVGLAAVTLLILAFRPRGLTGGK